LVGIIFLHGYKHHYLKSIIRRIGFMAYNAVEMADWQISEAAEKNMPTPDEWVDRLGLEKTRSCLWADWQSLIF